MSESEEKEKKKSGCFLLGCGGCLSGCLCFIFIFVLVIVFFISGPFEDFSGKMNNGINEESIPGFSKNSKAHLIVIPLHGIIQYGENKSGVISPDFVAAMLEKAEADPNAAGIILSIDSPGGEVNAADEIYQHIVSFRERTGLPVVALMRSIAASGGYYVAAACDYIVAGDMTLTGSIGVIISSYNFTGFLDMIGIEGEVYKSGAMKDMLSPVRKRTKEEIAVVQELVNECYRKFVKIVSDSRNIPFEKLLGSEMADGRIYHGKKAVSYGLVDKIGGLKDAAKVCEEFSNHQAGTLTIIKYTKSPDFLDFLLGIQGAAQNGMNVNIAVPGKTPSVELKPGRLYYLPAGI